MKKIPEEDNNILRYNHERKSMKALIVIYTDIEFLLKNRYIV